MTPLEYKQSDLPLPVEGTFIARMLTENKFVKVTVLKVNRKTVNVRFPDGVTVFGIPHDDIINVGGC